MSLSKSRIIDGTARQPRSPRGPRALLRWLALPLLLALVSGCSTGIRLAYNNAPQLAWWWLDSYVDFSREQAPSVKQALESLLDWHRATQLPEYLPLLADMQKLVPAPVTSAQACRWQDEVRGKLEPTLQRALELAAAQLPGLGEAQFKHIEAQQLKAIAEMREEFLQDDAAVRLRESVKRAVERAERLYGKLDEGQRRVVREGVAASPFDAALWLQERQRRQRELMATLRRLAAERADADQRLAALRALAAQTERSPDPVYRAYQARLQAYNCSFTAQIHNSTTAAQRQQALTTLKGWEDDLRALLPPQ